jgi:hypothetical protein
MLKEVHQWNESELRRMSIIAIAEQKWIRGMITEEEYNRTVWETH